MCSPKACDRQRGTDDSNSQQMGLLHTVRLSITRLASVDFAQLIKVYRATPEGERRYSPAEVISTQTVVGIGQPDPARICTSHVERQNLSMRMGIRRFTRLTNGFSRKFENHCAAIMLWFAFYNFCRIHQTLRVTPAMGAGITDHVWDLKEVMTSL
jgi:hypothetical protein